MGLLPLQNRFLALSVVLLTSFTGGVLTACSTSTQAQNQDSQTIANDISDRQPMNHGSGMIHNMAMDLGPADADYDLRFIDAMILHHQGAVDMAKEVQQKSNRPEMQKLAADIIKAQNQEIAQMQQWRKAWYPQVGVKPMAYHAKMNHVMEMSSEQIKAMKMSQDLGASDAKFDQKQWDTSPALVGRLCLC
ncbi:DUF305 domain-containing protein [Anabaena sp. CA = ATCC 33047]|uniref:DUF305 domain-containing protein n=1 Tax=Anabaena sp. (strain CA / ATCC 33047) TaxID=52271 RepID=UPI0008365C55